MTGATPLRDKLTTTSVKQLDATGQTYKVWDTSLTGFYVRVSPQGVKTFGVSYRHNGQSREYKIERFGKITADQARALAKTKLGKVAEGVDVQAEKKQARKQAKNAKHEKLGDFIDKVFTPWVKDHQRGHKEALRVLNTDFKHLHKKPMEEVTPWDIQKYIADKQKVGLQRTSINRRVATLKGVLTKAAEWGTIDRSPLAKSKQLKIDNTPRVRYLSDVEEAALRSALDTRQERQRRERDNHIEWLKARRYDTTERLTETYTDYLKPLVLVALNTGLRRGELFGLDWASVDLKGRLLTVTGETAKSGSARHIPLNDESFSALTAWRNQTNSSGLVFPSPTTDKRLDNVNSAWRNLMKEAGIKNFRFHDVRHHFASKLVMACVDLNTVRELLGHSDFATTLRYAHLAPEHKAAAVAVLNINTGAQR